MVVIISQVRPRTRQVLQQVVYDRSNTRPQSGLFTQCRVYVASEQGRHCGHRFYRLAVKRHQAGALIATLEGYTRWVYGALELTDGRLLSWAGDSTLHLWDGQSGALLTTLEGHTGGVRGALDGVSGVLELTDGRLLSWAWDGTLCLWDRQAGVLLETVSKKDAPQLHPNWLGARAKALSPSLVQYDCVG